MGECDRGDESLGFYGEHIALDAIENPLGRIADQQSRDTGTHNRLHYDQLDVLARGKLRDHFFRGGLAPGGAVFQPPIGSPATDPDLADVAPRGPVPAGFF